MFLAPNSFYRHGLMVLGLLCLILPVLSQSGSACLDTQGSTQRETYSSALLGQAMFYTVYLPPCYDPAGDAYPVLYLMHGSNDDDGQWLRLGLSETLDAMIADGSAPPMLVVMPFGNVIANRNRFDALSWANIFREELMPHAETSYRIATEPAQRAIGGISRGGFWAYQIAFTDPTQFHAVGGHSAFFDLYHAEPADNPLHLAIEQTGVEDLRIWLDRGADDFAAPGLDIMGQRLTEQGLPHDYMIYDEGEHNNAYWSQHVRTYLEFYVRDWVQSPPPAPRSAFATNTPMSSVPTASPTATSTPSQVSAAPTLYPVVAFPSLLTSLASERLQALADGQLDVQLVLDSSAAEALVALGYTLHPETRLVPDEELREVMWRDRNLITLLPLNRLSLEYRVLWVDDQPLETQLADYPFAPSSQPDNRLTRLTLSGVTALARNTRIALDEQGVEWAAGGIAPYVQWGDIFHISNEVSRFSTCPQGGDELGGASSFCAKPEHMQLFDLLDVDIVELSGNHNNDYGYEAYRDTLTFYQERDMLLVGGGETQADAREPLVIEHNGNRIGWLSCNTVGPYYALVNEDPNLLGGVRPGAAACDWDWLDLAVPELAQIVDVTIVTIQHQEIEDYLPIPQQQFDFRRLAELGADVVMNTASHKPQTYEFYQTRRGSTTLIHYGMGNLFFDQPFWGNRRFFLNTLLIHEGELRGIELFPGIIDELARPRLMTAEERENFLFFMLREQNGF